MNKYLKYGGCILTVAFMLAGCDDYLKEDSGDLVVPKKVDEYSPMLYAEGYPSNFTSEVGWFKLMTDDVEMSQLEVDPSSSVVTDGNKNFNAFDAFNGGEGQRAYAWHEDIEMKLSDNFWGARYGNILACNLIIDALPTMEYVEQDSGKYNYLAAQAYALRAYHYWCLVNTYALPHSQASLDKPGVIIRTEPQVDIKARERASIGKVYSLINEDIQKAEHYMISSKVSGNKHLLTEPAVWLLASRIALFQENWDEVIRVGKLFLQQNTAVFNLSNVDTTLLGAYSDTEGFCMMDGKVNPEIVFTFGGNVSNYAYLSKDTDGSFYGLGFRSSFREDGSLMMSYEEGDLRKKAYFMKDIPAKKAQNWWEEDQPKKYCYHYPVKYRRRANANAEKPNDKLYHENWRSVEVMLNLAEAYVRKTNSVNKDAVVLLNTLRAGRFAKDKFVEKKVADFAGSEDLVKFIWAERRRELCFEEAMRLWDLRRQGMPAITHKWYSSWDTYETYTLREGSPNYVLAIPNAELYYNGVCADNTREMIIANH